MSCVYAPLSCVWCRVGEWRPIVCHRLFLFVGLWCPVFVFVGSGGQCLCLWPVVFCFVVVHMLEIVATIHTVLKQMNLHKLLGSLLALLAQFFACFACFALLLIIVLAHSFWNSEEPKLSCHHYTSTMF